MLSEFCDACMYVYVFQLVQLASALSSTEQEITMRNKAVESDWSAVAVADLQTTSEGKNKHTYTHTFVAHHL